MTVLVLRSSCEVEGCTATPNEPHEHLGDPPDPQVFEERYGFTYGPMKVSRTARLDIGPREVNVLSIETRYQTIEVYVSRTGRSVRVYRRRNGEDRAVEMKA